jgi:hypothetical protein
VVCKGGMGIALPARLKQAAERVLSLVQSDAALGDIERAVRECYARSRDVGLEERANLLAVLAPALSSSAAERTLTIGYLCGALVEDGCPPDAIEAPLLGCYLELAERARRLYDACRAHVLEEGGEFTEQDFEEAMSWAEAQLPDDHAAYRLLARAPQPAISVLSASAAARRRGRPLAGILAPLEGELTAARDLVRLSRVLDDEPYLALEPATRRALRGRMHGVSDNGQLQLLLMDVMAHVYGEPVRVSRAAVRNAHGVGPQDLDEVAEATFTLYDWRAARVAGLLTNDDHVLWNEATPADIPAFEGERVLLLAPPRYRRTWRVQREFDMRADLSADAVLSEAEAEALYTRLAEAASAKPKA